MPRKKKLKVNGCSIISHAVVIKKVTSEHTGDLIEIVHLDVTTNDGIFSYEIYKDERFPDLNWVRDYIDTTLIRARKDCLNVEMSEYVERIYLFFDIQKVGQHQYSGRRV
ncbi:hypothetical protein SAMN05660691_02314 [Rheinheimera pacifica]|uniref:Uncharacterized protein n=1 Tax=Rheinheimera pacifica TaxID=173990 RepID=A0A1H6M6B0_9GAMM|nr:hypothetical protein [Rheinheimera pacifica]SEH94444.1 hypothetical protein SAMN05660691_02314 [Rheinheimera pacifica]